jgi:hypothetical protein
LRGIDARNTFAVMQWYAWPDGGHFAPGKWFWADQAQQWQQRQRLPWVAVSILLPIEPVGDIRSHTAAVTEIAQAVQQGLLVQHLCQQRLRPQSSCGDRPLPIGRRCARISLSGAGIIPTGSLITAAELSRILAPVPKNT